MSYESTNSTITHSEKKRTRSILELSNTEAHDFLLKAESYCNFDLPPYFVFDGLLEDVRDQLDGKDLEGLICKGEKAPRNHDDVNYTILNNKDGRYAWRPLQLIHPVLYVSLVKKITENCNWNLIKNRFQEFSKNKKNRCLSLPVVSQSDEKDKAEQISYWWQEFEQRSIELALDFDCLLETDITDCYGAIYTHSIAWALHTKECAKKTRKKNDLIGNQIDNLIQDMRHGQTNGIPQGSVLMDFIAEMVLGYADLILSKRIGKANIDDYQILRYRDDYRIFCNNPRKGEEIVKLLTEVMIELGLKLNLVKTKVSDDVIRASIKKDKIAWFTRKKSEKSLQKHLLIIHDHSLQFPNAGSLIRALQDYYTRIEGKTNIIEEPLPIISIVVDIAYRNPRTYAVCAAILSKLLTFLNEGELCKKCVIEKIRKRFKKIPNTGHLQIWLQRIAYPNFKVIPFDERLCKLVSGKEQAIWNVEWISSKDLKNTVNPSKIIDRAKLEQLESTITANEFRLYIQRRWRYYA